MTERAQHGHHVLPFVKALPKRQKDKPALMIQTSPPNPDTLAGFGGPDLTEKVLMLQGLHGMKYLVALGRDSNF